MPRFKTKLEDDRMCFACGENNPAGLKLKFQMDERGVQIKTVFIPQNSHQGFAKIVHGGLIALILDEAMVNLLWRLKIQAVSAHLEVRLKNPAYVGEPLNFKAWIAHKNSKIIYTESQAYKNDGKIVATACAKCVKV